MRAALLLACLVASTAAPTAQGESAALLARADRERLAGRHAQAIAEYERARAASEQVGDAASEAAAWQGLGATYTAQSDYPRAMGCLERALALRERLGDASGVAASLSGIGIVHRQQGRFPEAIAIYRRALNMLGSEDRLQRARLLNNLGVAHVAQADYDVALGYYRESLVIHEALGNVSGQASTLSNIGIVHRRRGDNAAALAAFERGLSLARDSGDRATTAEALKAIGVLHSSQGNASVAMEYYEQARAIFADLGNRLQIALIGFNVGLIQQRAGRPAEARTSFLESLRIRESIGDRAGIAESRQSLGGLARSLGDLDTAEREYGSALAGYVAIGDRRGEVIALAGLQSVANHRGDHEIALSLGARAAALARTLGDRERLWQTLTASARAHAALGRPDRARDDLAEAIRTIESLRDDVAGSDADRQRAFEPKVAPYHALLSLSLAEGKVADALTMAEGAKARVVLDILQSGRVRATSAMTPSEQAEERDVARALAAVSARLQLEQRRNPGDPALIGDLEQQQGRARAAREAFEARLYAAHPELRRHRGETPPADLDEIAAALPAGTAALQYVVMQDEVWLFVLARSSPGAGIPPRLSAHRLSIAPADLGRLVERLDTELAQRDLGFRATAARAWKALLAAAAPELTRSNALVIVPDGVLWRVPFQALWNGRSAKYLLETHAIAYAPSLSVFATMRRADPRSNTAPVGDTLLALGDPASGGPADGGSTRRLDPIAPLPRAAAEVRALGRLYGLGTSRVLVGAEAREDRFKSEAPRYSMLHLATHGVLDDTSPMYSRVLLTASPEPGGDDGQLYAWELAQLQLNARLVVLSACETARGRIAPGEGVIGLTWALLIAGASTTVVSQWAVDSASTSDLMRAFHRSLAGNRPTGQPAVPAARALRRAAIPLIRSARYGHPFYWAAFVVVGDGL